jgi:hypothetical protein
MEDKAVDWSLSNDNHDARMIKNASYSADDILRWHPIHNDSVLFNSALAAE